MCNSEREVVSTVLREKMTRDKERGEGLVECLCLCFLLVILVWCSLCLCFWSCCCIGVLVSGVLD